MSELKLNINEQLQRMNMLMHRAAFSHFGHNPHRGQGRVLALLKLKPEISQKELTYLLNMSKQSAAELIAKLEKSGYVTREPDERDKRVMQIRLTDKGAQSAIDADDSAFETTQVLDCLRDDELAVLSGYLGRIIKEYEGIFPDDDFDRRRQAMSDFMSHFGHGHHDSHGFRGHGFEGNPFHGKDFWPHRNGGDHNERQPSDDEQ